MGDRAPNIVFPKAPIERNRFREFRDLGAGTTFKPAAARYWRITAHLRGDDTSQPLREKQKRDRLRFQS